VNLASRVENLTKKIGAPLLITAASCARLENKADLADLPPQELRGVDGPVKVFAFGFSNRTQ
jgi:class 3 adenylate cyclase